MKKIILSFALLLSLCVGAVAQTKVVFRNGPIGLDWKFKRSFLHGNSLVVDFVVENNTGKDMNCLILVSASTHIGSLELKAYDDEGTVYSSSILQYENKFSGKIGSKNSLYDWEMIPRDNLVKVRLQIADIDEYATIIKTLTIPVRVCPNGTINEVYGEIRVSNIPIPREE